MLCALLIGSIVIAASEGGVGAPDETNFLFIMGDDFVWLNLGAYPRGMSPGKRPNLEKLAAHGMLFTDY